MDRQRMHRLGKKLIALSRDVELEPQDDTSNPAERLVLGDVALYPRSTIRDIVERTGFTQGYVSKCVADLAIRGLVNTEIDDVDRRRTLVSPTSQLVRAIDRRTVPVEELIRRALPHGHDAKRVLAMLREVADALLD
jgi:DNA-binding MarR family transcriptional regulator